MEGKNIMLAAIIALIIGGVGGYAIGNNMNDSSKEADSSLVENGTTTSPAADLRVGLNNALREHVDLAGVTLRNVYTKAPDTDATLAALDENSVEVAGLVGSVYGDEAQEQFLGLWRDHIQFFADYTVGKRDNDQKMVDEAKANLAGYGQAASKFFADANPNLPQEAVMPMLEEHRDMVLGVIDTIDDGDFDSAYKKLNQAADQVGTIGDALAGGIEKQYPEKF